MSYGRKKRSALRKAKRPVSKDQRAAYVREARRRSERRRSAY